MSQLRALRLLNRYGYLEGKEIPGETDISFHCCREGMDEIDISVSGAEMMSSSQMMQALTMFQSFYGKAGEGEGGSHYIHHSLNVCRCRQEILSRS